MKIFAIVVISLGFMVIAAPSQASRMLATPVEPPADFKGDGCTAFPDGDWGDCCFEHDKAYFRGGTARERREADKKLYQCVKAKGGLRHAIIAPIMWMGVRVGGMELLHAPFSWGFGQPGIKK